MRIGKVAEGAGVSVRALRYYEEQGLVIADRSPSGHRQYPESAVERVKFIQLQLPARRGSVQPTALFRSRWSFYRCHSTTPVSLAILVNIICTRWKIERISTARRAWPDSTRAR